MFLKRLFVVFCALLSLAALAGLHGNTRAFSAADMRKLGRAHLGANYVPRHLLVQFRKPVDDLAIKRAIHPEGGVAAENIWAESLGNGTNSPYLVHLDHSTTVEAAMQRLAGDPNVEFAEPDYYLHPAETPDDPLFGQMWDMLNTGGPPFGGKAGADIDATRAWDITTGSDAVVAAVIDTGVDISHPDISPNVWVNPNPGASGFADDLHGWNFFGNNNQVFVSAAADYHGTHVAGTIGAVGNNGLGVAGMAWHVKIMTLKFMGMLADGTIGGSTANAIQSINYVAAERQLGINVRVINASWDGPKPSAGLRKAIIKAQNAGILFVCAAGNVDSGGLNMDDPANAFYPAAWNDLPGLISAAAVDDHDGLAGFSNYGRVTVSVAAPGVQITSTLPQGSYGPLSGTSMASPHVAGIAVLLAANEPGLAPADIKQRIVGTSQPIVSLASLVESAGRVNAYNALTSAVPAPGPPAVSAVAATRKVVTVDGIGFLNSQAVIEVNGTAIGPTTYNTSFQIANGTLTEISVRLGKAGIRNTFPIGAAVMLDVFNPSTGQRSPSVSFTRLQ